MRILLAFYPIDDMGGIINHNEQLCAGLQEIGHTVETRIFLPRKDVPRNGLAGGRGTFSPHTGLEFDQRRGYSWTRGHCIPYLGAGNMIVAQTMLAEYDLVIWQVAVPTKRKENRGNSDWELLYQSGAPNLAVIHDGNFLASYPWLCDVQEHLRGLICVHHCAFHSARNISVPSSFIPNPQEIGAPPDLSMSAWGERQPGVLSVQTFKAWKHVPEYVAAIPHMNQSIIKFLAGKGIDYYYLTSKDKCKWPDIWNHAIQSGMVYLDVITNEVRDSVLRNVTCLLDPSWSLKYSQIGGHFNRVLVDAIKCGTLPVVRPLGISTNLEGSGELFKAGVNCVAIPQGVTPREYGRLLSEACTMPYPKWHEIMSNAVELLPMFERKHVARQVVELLEGDSQQLGKTTPEVEAAAEHAYHTFFGAS